jgi:hypothetical protein
MKAKEFDKKFDANKNMLAHLDLSKIKRSIQRVNVDFPEWMVTLLDKEAKRLGVSRQSVIKVWIAEKLKAA